MTMRPARKVRKTRIKYGKPEGASVTRVVVMLVILLLFAVGATMILNQNEQKARVDARAEELADLEAEVIADNEQAQALADKVGSDTFIEEIARNELGMVKTGEMIFDTDSSS